MKNKSLSDRGAIRKLTAKLPRDFQGIETVVMDQQKELQTLIDTHKIVSRCLYPMNYSYKIFTIALNFRALII